MPYDPFFRTDRYAVGIDRAAADSSDEGAVAIVKFGQHGAPDELVASLTWEEARLVARAVSDAGKEI